MSLSEEDLQKKYYELKSIDDHIKKIDRELTIVERKIIELDEIKLHISEISKMSNKDALIPLADGIFVKAKLLEQGKFIVNVGSGVCVPKNTSETIALMDVQSSELNKYRESLMSKLDSLDSMARKIEEEFLVQEKILNAKKE